MEVRLILRYIIYTVLLVLLQLVLFDYVQLGHDLYPFVYVLAILLLPIEIPRAVPLILAFIIGFLMDVFNDTIAFNTGALVFAAFLRPFILQMLSPGDGYEIGKLPSYLNMGIGWFLGYSFIFLFFHQLVYFSFEIFMLAKIHIVLFKALINSVYSLVFVFILHLLFFRNK